MVAAHIQLQKDLSSGRQGLSRDLSDFSVQNIAVCLQDGSAYYHHAKMRRVARSEVGSGDLVGVAATRRCFKNASA